MYELCWWDAVTGEDGLMGSQDLIGVTPEMVKEWFNIPPNEPPIYCYTVEFHHAELIQPYFKGAFNFGRYDYTVEAVADFPGETVDCNGKTLL